MTQEVVDCKILLSMKAFVFGSPVLVFSSCANCDLATLRVADYSSFATLGVTSILENSFNVFLSVS